ncbi:FAA-hydrolase-family protein [Citrobacter koseri]|nr:FAA-hydrolase-family protein [Citrobacter koseri]
MSKYVFEPQAPVAVPVVGSDEQFPVRRVYCVGRNYAAHAREMGFDPDREPPFFFCKPADAVVPLRLAKRWRWPIRRRPITITMKLNWWWR